MIYKLTKSQNLYLRFKITKSVYKLKSYKIQSIIYLKKLIKRSSKKETSNSTCDLNIEHQTLVTNIVDTIVQLALQIVASVC